MSLVPIGDGQSHSALADDRDQAPILPVVAESPAFKEKLKTINFGRVPGGNR